MTTGRVLWLWGLAVAISAVLRLGLAAVGLWGVTPATAAQGRAPAVRRPPERLPPSLVGCSTVTGGLRMWWEGEQGEAPARELALKWKDESQWREIFESYQTAGLVEFFRGKYDAVPVRVLGMAGAEFRAWVKRAVANGSPIPVEPIPVLHDRYTGLNHAFPSALSRVPFQALCYHSQDAVEAVVGQATGGLGMAPKNLAKWIVASKGRSFGELTASAQARIHALMEMWYADYVTARQSLWEAIWPEVQRGATGVGRVDRIAAALVIGNRVRIFRVGFDGEIDGCLRAMESAEEDAREFVQGLFR